MFNSEKLAYDYEKRSQEKDAECRAVRAYMVRLSTKRGYRFQENHKQRVFGPPIGEENQIYDYKHEVFIYNIPYNCYENSIIHRFLSIGELYEFRFFLSNNGYARGFAFACYKTVEHARMAIQRINFLYFQGHVIKVIQSTNRRLIALAKVDGSKVPPNTSEQEYVFNYMRVKFPLILKNMDVRRIVDGRQLYILEFISHRACVNARNVMLVDLQHHFGNQAYIRWGWKLHFID